MPLVRTVCDNACSAVQVKILHEDRPKGIVAFERVDGLERNVTVINLGQSSWQAGEYGCWVGGGSFKEVFSSQVGIVLPDATRYDLYSIDAKSAHRKAVHWAPDSSHVRRTLSLEAGVS